MLDLDQIPISKLCCHCYCEMPKVKYDEKEIIITLCSSYNELWKYY